MNTNILEANDREEEKVVRMFGEKSRERSHAIQWSREFKEDRNALENMPGKCPLYLML